MLRCASHFPEMTEEFADKNLESRAESYLTHVVLTSIPNSIAVLHTCDTLISSPEEITNLVPRLINSIANNACKEQLASGLPKLNHTYPSKLPIPTSDPNTPSNWWGKSLVVLSLDFFHRVLTTVKSKGLKQDVISNILINYAHNSL
ncbi:unnamed protein product [Linum trigynum]|uniref:NPH3 domain-containing protein n=1 Tax=Linum trigynum TaxID=586398 RepID=A0AAV2F229_9ROSI